MGIIDGLLNRITMYRLTLYYLRALIFFAVVLSFFRLLPYSPVDILLSTFVAVSLSGIANLAFAKIFHAITNIESVTITALILVLIIPVSFPRNLPFIVLASVVAMAVKYLPV